MICIEREEIKKNEERKNKTSSFANYIVTGVYCVYFLMTSCSRSQFSARCVHMNEQLARKVIISSELLQFFTWITSQSLGPLPSLIHAIHNDAMIIIHRVSWHDANETDNDEYEGKQKLPPFAIL